MSVGDVMRPRALIVGHGTAAGADLAVGVERIGYAVCGVVEAAGAAVELAEAASPALVLVSLRMADGGDGVEAARRIAAVHDAVILFLATEADDAALSRAFEVAPFGYLLEPFTSRNLEAAVALARARHARDASVVRRLTARAATDPLTGLPNRRRLDEALALEWRRCQRAGAPLSVVLADIDRFKAINDGHGHAAGDRCLVAVAARLVKSCRRAGDVVGRWGGDEFLAVLPNTDEAGASHVAESMARAVREVRLPGMLPPPAVVTTSVGMATVVPGGAGNPMMLVEQADHGLLAAKQRGRDGGAEAST